MGQHPKNQGRDPGKKNREKKQKISREQWTRGKQTIISQAEENYSLYLDGGGMGPKRETAIRKKRVSKKKNEHFAGKGCGKSNNLSKKTFHFRRKNHNNEKGRGRKGGKRKKRGLVLRIDGEKVSPDSTRGEGWAHAGKRHAVDRSQGGGEKKNYGKRKITGTFICRVKERQETKSWGGVRGWGEAKDVGLPKGLVHIQEKISRKKESLGWPPVRKQRR